MWFKPLLSAGICAVLCTGAAAGALTKPFNYRGTQYRLTVSPSGRLENCFTGKEKFFSSLELYGSYEHPGESYDDRMFQGNASPVSTAVEKRDGNRVRLVSTGMLGNAKVRQAAAFEQTVDLEPSGFTMHWKVTSKVPMKTHTLVFSAIMQTPVEPMIDLGIVAGSQRDQVITIPASCERNKGLRKYGIGIMWFSFPDAILNIVAGEKSCFTALDCRSWGEPLFRLDFTPVSVWKNDLAEYPAGTVREWSAAFRFTPYED